VGCYRTPVYDLGTIERMSILCGTIRHILGSRCRELSAQQTPSASGVHPRTGLEKKVEYCVLRASMNHQASETVGPPTMLKLPSRPFLQVGNESRPTINEGLDDRRVCPDEWEDGSGTRRTDVLLLVGTSGAPTIQKEWHFAEMPWLADHFPILLRPLRGL
jgi:hypothetical protein